MSDDGARVLHAAIKIRAADAQVAARATQAAEAALRRALERIAVQFRGSVVIVRRIDLRLRSTGDGPPDERSLERAITQAIGTRLEAARGGPFVDRSAGIAVFGSEGEALGTWLVAHVRSRESDWPVSVLARDGSVRDAMLARELAVAGDALAHASTQLAPGELATLPAGWSAELSDRWARAPAAIFDGDALPAEITERVRDRIAIIGRSGPAAHLEGLAALFAEWPPARAMHVDEDALARLTGTRERVASLRSRAGGLVAWQWLFADHGLADELRVAYGIEREHRAARVALARALEGPDCRADDPIFLAFVREAPDARPLDVDALLGIDPEPMHRVAIALADRERLLGSLVVSRVGDECVACAGDLPVDLVPIADPHDAVETIASRLARRLGRSPPEITVAPLLSDAALDAVHALMPPDLPGGWCAASLALAAVGRALLRDRWSLDVDALRGWRARVEGDVIVLPRARARLVPVRSDVLLARRWTVTLA